MAGNKNFVEAFHDMFAASINVACCVADAGVWSDHVWNWKLVDLVNSNDGVDQNTWNEFETLVQEVSMLEYESDAYEWLKEDDIIFKVKSCVDLF